jgi:hypothetical protein
MTHSLILYVQSRPKTTTTYKQETNLYTDSRHKGKGKELRILDNVFKETSIVFLS